MKYFWEETRTVLGGVICALSLVSWSYAGTVEIRVVSGNDDAEQHITDFDGAANRLDLTSSDLELGSEDNAADLQEIGIRFVDIPVGQGIGIDSSFIQFTVDELNDVATSLRIFGELSPNSSPFSTTASDITNRTKTTSFVDWNNIPAWTAAGDAGADQRTPSLTPILQEIFNQPTWASGNALSFIVVPNPGGERTAESFDGSFAQAPQLVFTGANVPDVVLPPPPEPPAPPAGVPANFNTYTAESLPQTASFGIANWVVSDVVSGSGDGRTVSEATNASYTMFYGPDDVLNSRITGTFTPGGDDDFVGFVLGFLPGDADGTNSDASYLLIDWKGTNQNFDFDDVGGAPEFHNLTGSNLAPVGLAISAVHGRPTADELWGHVDLPENPGGGVIELARGTNLGSTPYNRAGGSHAVEIIFDAGTVKVSIDGVEELDVTGVFGNGRFGLYEGYQSPSGAFTNFGIEMLEAFSISGSGQTYFQDFDEMGVRRSTPRGWKGEDNNGPSGIDGLGLTDGFLTVPGNSADGVLGILNLGGSAESFGPAPDGHVATWSAELGGDTDLYGRDDVIADNAGDRALGTSRENNNDIGELNFEIEIVDGALRAFVFDWDLEIWGGDPDGVFRSPEGPGMKVDVQVGGTSYHAETKNLLPGALFDSTEDGSNPDHNPTLIDGNVYSIRNISSGIKEISDVDGAVGNMVQVNFNSNWNGATDDGANGWISAIDNVRLRALAPGDADANGVVDVTDLLALLGGQKFNQGVQGVTWEQGDFNADDQFDTSDLLAMLSFLSGTFPSDPYASEAGGANDAVADIIVNSETGEVTVDLAGHTVSAVIIESASEIFNGSQPAWDTTSQFPTTLPGELGNVLFTSTASGTDELGAVISAEFLGRDKDFYLQDLDLNILIASEGGALTKGNVIVVPEPSTWLLLGLGSLTLVGIVRRRQS